MRRRRAWGRGLAIMALLGVSGFASGQGCPGEGSCLKVHQTPGCDDAACCEAVCAEDSFCCKVSWDLACVQMAVRLCGACPAPGHCLNFHENPGCSDEACCEAVCDIEPLCCQTQWSGMCAGIAEDICLGLCLGDQNADSTVDVQDLVIVITDWACTTPPGPGPGDVQGDGVVDVTDLVLVILEWGRCP